MIRMELNLEIRQISVLYSNVRYQISIFFHLVQKSQYVVIER